MREQVRLIARKIHERLPETVALDDLLSSGVIGLINAIDNFVRNHQSSATVTPAPPSFQAPSRNCFTRVSLVSISATRSRNAPVPFP